MALSRQPHNGHRPINLWDPDYYLLSALSGPPCENKSQSRRYYHGLFPGTMSDVAAPLYDWQTGGVAPGACVCVEARKLACFTCDKYKNSPGEEHPVAVPHRGTSFKRRGGVAATTLSRRPAITSPVTITGNTRKEHKDTSGGLLDSDGEEFWELEGWTTQTSLRLCVCAR